MERGELLLKTPRDGAGICPHNHCVARMITDMFHDELDGYLLYLKLTEIQEKVKAMQSTLEKELLHYLTLEDPSLSSHIAHAGLSAFLPYERWFGRLFADTMPSSCLVRIWDKLVSRSFMILVFVGVASLIVSCRAIIRTKDPTRIAMCLQKFDVETGLSITNKATEVWMKHGSLMNPSVSACHSM
jgi:hypothetical protein